MSKKGDAQYSEDVSIISSSVKLEGKLYSQGNVRIDGVIIGDVTVNGNLTIGEASKIEGNIKAKNITISGNILGSVDSAEKLIIEKSAYLKGDIITRVLLIDEGAQFVGNCTMSNTKDHHD
ncbi:MAG: polymer-forming cytoskeletal protein [Melioribacteraceae bacterium]|nr:polymer-forming cytoskeletal protein [Melioribacteraceae bacterium]MCF8264637.1 polymer-forming cytoskeletal protein [Melioribacteraceae bacterium]MCF8411989.1 polymer-forming cytoskeletal protein [Melioribacteraceae bacterium]